MKLKGKNLRQGTIKVTAESPDDLWYLSQVIDEGDIVRSRTIRKIAIEKSEGERKGQVRKQPMALSIQVQKIEYHQDTLRLLGPIVDGPAEVPRGEHHSFSIVQNTELTIQKKRWLSFQLDRIDSACKEEGPDILVVLLDREEALFARLRRYGYDILSRIKGSVHKKEPKAGAKGDFYEQITKALLEYDARYSPSQIIVASPAFWAEEYQKSIMGNPLEKKIIRASCSSSEEPAISEVLRRPETAHALLQDRYSKEIMRVERLLEVIAKGGAAAYGLREVRDAGNAGAISEILLTDAFIQNMRNDGKYHELESLLHSAESQKARIVMISSSHDAGRKLDGLGGIASLLRYRIS